MTDHPDIGAALATLEAAAQHVPPAEVPALVIRLAAVLATVGARSVIVPPNREPAQPSGGGDRLTIAQVAKWNQCSVKTVQRRMRDGTWRRGEHWFGKGRAVRFSRKALETWATTADASRPARGLAYGDGIPEGRRHRRLTSLRNKGTEGHGATTGAETDGAAG